MPVAYKIALNSTTVTKQTKLIFQRQRACIPQLMRTSVWECWTPLYQCMMYYGLYLPLRLSNECGSQTTQRSRPIHHKVPHYAQLVTRVTVRKQHEQQ